MLTIQNCW